VYQVITQLFLLYTPEFEMIFLSSPYLYGFAESNHLVIEGKKKEQMMCYGRLEYQGEHGFHGNK